VQNLIVQRMEPEAVLALTGRVLRRKTAGGQDKTLLDSPAELAETLEREFGISGVDVAKLWPKVAARHDELFAEKLVEQIVVAGM
jgi:arylamine N-acetyltransferase